jgi:hypothetical protein
MFRSTDGGKQLPISKFVTTSPSTAVQAAFRNVPRSPIDGFPTRRDGLLDDGVIKDEDVKQSNAGKRLERLLNETAGLLAKRSSSRRRAPFSR